jgi:hypothetical protein
MAKMTLDKLDRLTQDEFIDSQKEVSRLGQEMRKGFRGERFDVGG